MPIPVVVNACTCLCTCLMLPASSVGGRLKCMRLSTYIYIVFEHHYAFAPISCSIGQCWICTAFWLYVRVRQASLVNLTCFIKHAVESSSFCMLSMCMHQAGFSRASHSCLGDCIACMCHTSAMHVPHIFHASALHALALDMMFTS